MSLNVSYLRQLHDDSGLTLQQAADRCAVPLPTYNRIIHGQTKDPSFYTISAIVIGLNGSLDVLAGIKSPMSTDIPEQISTDYIHGSLIPKLQLSFDDGIKTIQDINARSIEHYQREIREKDLWMKRLFIYALTVTLALIISTLVLDCNLW